MLSRLREIKKGERGFTLIELLIVIVIIAVLAAVAVPTYSRYIISARASEAPQILTSMITWAKGYVSAHDGNLPPSMPGQFDDSAEYFTYAYNSPLITATGIAANGFTGDDTLSFNLTTEEWSSAGIMTEVQPPN